MIDQGVTAALAARDANRNGNDSHTSGTGRPVQVARECTYPDFLKCQPLNFKGTKGVVGLRHYRSDCPELKNQDHGNQAGGTGAHGMVHALKGGETNQDHNDVEDDINA
uniref:Reverse transcriptase domain-containing protein n=1 Tax=Tanacetum cinerariifolium TaxID=118510 RepID=A0A699JWU9_TANCI|nr:hypothetical protein [Tanacetum cinerariifolium]